ncbi:Major facilitator superfamily domain-containing protein 1 [Mizuhopecten yessoensis]|uniref:Lysosomal dipeptide transporter MFSD1 n=1 Tax=Mizuhopecten yessoensis TaxID=6573 RepID=A0A210QIA0_MIZYE|nr:Major facilitator superfamily domain-containing protein 1 [Mizuhopecten yessoensis]
MKIHEWRWRYPILVCDCLLALGCYYNIGVPSALQADIQGSGDYNCTHNNVSGSAHATCCEECLGLGPQKYNLLFSVLSWTSAIVSIPGGFFIDKIGNRASAVLIPTIFSTGMLLFALAGSPVIRGTPYMFPLMLIGRMTLGFGTGPGRVLQNRVVSFWFRDNSVMPVSFLIFTIRSGNVLNFFLTANLAQWFGLPWSLWIGALVCCIGLVAGIGLAVLDSIGTKQLDEEARKQMESKPINLRDMKSFPSSYWYLIVMLTCFYSSVIPFVSNATKFFQDRYGYSKTDASYVNGAVYDVALLAPIFGKILEKIDCHGIVGMVATLVTIPVYLTLAYVSQVSPLAMSICIGVTFNCNAIILWQAMMAMIPPTSYGTAAGLASSCMGIGMGTSALIVGTILGQKEEKDVDVRLQKYQYMLLLFACLTALSFLSAVFMNVSDIRSVSRHRIK